MKKTSKFWGEFIVLFITLIIAEKVSNYLGINREKIFSLHYLVVFVISVIIYYIRNFIMRKITNTTYRQRNFDE